MTGRVTSIWVGVLLAALALATSVQAAPPPNDDFGSPSPLTVGDEISATNLEATSQANEPEPAVVYADECEEADSAPHCGSSVWFQFEAPASSEYTIETCDQGTDFDTVLGVYTGTSIGALIEVASNDDGFGGDCAGGGGARGSRVTFAATAGTAYQIDLAGFTAERGSFYLRAYEGPAQIYIGPDTSIDGENSYVGGRISSRVNFPGVLSGPRHSPSFSLLGTNPDSTFECALDGSGFSPCTSPVSYDDLAAGSSHVFAARARADGFTDPTPVIERFSIDTEPPETTFTIEPLPESPSTTLTWAYTSSEPQFNGSPFICSVDDWPSIGCEIELVLDDLCQGTHEFRAAAWDLAGNVDPTPATSSTEVTTGAPCAPPTIQVPVAENPPGPHDSGELGVDFDDQGAGGVLSIEYGPTTAYGSTGSPQPIGPSGSGGHGSFLLQELQPATTYHYKITLTTPFGSIGTSDQTFTTTAAEVGEEPAVIENGTPRLVGLHAAELPVSIDGRGFATNYRLLISAGAPVGPGAVEIFDQSGPILGSEVGPQLRSVEVVDLDPGKYHYRFIALQSGPAGTSTLGPEGSFDVQPKATPLPPPPDPTRTTPFKLKRKNVKVGKLRRRSKKLTVRFSGLPAKTKLRVRLKVGNSKQTATRKANSRGKARLKITLAKRIRKALKETKVKKATLKVTATPPGAKPSSIVLKPKLKR